MTTVVDVTTQKRARRRAKYLPARMLDRFGEALHDPDLLSLRNEIALIDVYMDELTDRLEKEEPAPTTWAKLSKEWDKFTLAIRSGNEREQARLLSVINSLIEHGATQEQVWSDIFDYAEKRRKLAESEEKRLSHLEQNISVEQALTMMTATINVLRECVFRYAEPKVARSILADAREAHKRIISLQSGSNDDSESMG